MENLKIQGSLIQVPNMRKITKIVYTCVTGSYDKLYPPLVTDPSTRYVALTDDTKLNAPGWEVRVIGNQSNLTPSLLNRQCKIFPWRYLPEANLNRLFDLLDDRHPIVLLRHPQRNFVREELDACVSREKVTNRNVLDAEYEALLEEGFVDNGLLTENSIIIRSHESKKLRAAMAMWWGFVEGYGGRDQISLQHCLFSQDVRPLILPFNARERNPFFDKYPHLGKITTYRKRLKATFHARRMEGKRFYVLSRVLNMFL